jgi:hypothetical protein
MLTADHDMGLLRPDIVLEATQSDGPLVDLDLVLPETAFNECRDQSLGIAELGLTLNKMGHGYLLF